MSFYAKKNVIPMNVSLIAATTFAMFAFAGNSVLCRLALEQAAIDPASFTSVRLISGAIMLIILMLVKPFQKSALTTQHAFIKNSNSVDDLKISPAASLGQKLRWFIGFNNSSWFGGIFLFAYAAGFSFAYISLPTGTGALILFAAVQITMLSYAIFNAVRLSSMQCFGLFIALLGLIYLLLPGISSPPIFGSLLMVIAGISWGAYSILGKTAINATQSSVENFTRAIVPALLLSLIFYSELSITSNGILLAIASGAITSGLGYAVWYAVLPQLKSASAASLQLTVPVIATLGGVIFLNEALSVRLTIASIAILGGVALVVLMPTKTTPRVK